MLKELAVEVFSHLKIKNTFLCCAKKKKEAATNLKLQRCQILMMTDLFGFYLFLLAQLRSKDLQKESHKTFLDVFFCGSKNSNDKEKKMNKTKKKISNI